jgi:hypothetical protein
MAIARYFRDGRGSETEIVQSPDWSRVAQAISAMDDYCSPLVLLSTLDIESSPDIFEDDDAFNVVGGNGRYALFHMTGEWQYSNPEGSDEEVRLWASDQGYFCSQRNVLMDLSQVLRVVQRYYETGSYADLDEVT